MRTTRVLSEKFCLWRYLKYPISLFFLGMVMGILIGLIEIIPSDIISVSRISESGSRLFQQIATTNCSVIFTIYIMSIFTCWYAYFVYLLNGVVLGLYLALIIKVNFSLIWLILPHGLFEIPIILATGFIASKGEAYIRNNMKMYIKLLTIHILATLACAAFEAFVTPLFQYFVF